MRKNNPVEQTNKGNIIKSQITSQNFQAQRIQKKKKLRDQANKKNK